MTDVQEAVEPSGGSSGEIRPSILKQTVGGGSGHSAVSNGQSERASDERTERVTNGTNGVSNGVSHSPSSEEEEQVASLSAAETVDLEEISERDLGLEIFPDDVVEDGNAEYIVYDEVTQSESAASTSSERPASDRAEAEDEYKEFGEQQEEIVIEDVSDVHIPPQPEPVVEEPKTEKEPQRKFEEFTAPSRPIESHIPYRNPYGVTGRRPIREVDDYVSSNRKRKADLDDDSDKKRRLNDSTSSGSSWSPGWRFWSVAAPQTPSTEGDSMFVNVDGKSPRQSFSAGAGSSEDNLSFGSGSSWRKYCNIM